LGIEGSRRNETRQSVFIGNGSVLLRSVPRRFDLIAKPKQCQLSDPRCVAEENALRLHRKNLYQTCPSQSVQVLADFVQLVLVVDQFCSIAQLFSARLRVTFERILKYETAYKIATCNSVPRRGSCSQFLPPLAGRI